MTRTDTTVETDELTPREIEQLSERAPEGVSIGPTPDEVLDNSVRTPSDRVQARVTDETDSEGGPSA